MATQILELHMRPTLARLFPHVPTIAASSHFYHLPLLYHSALSLSLFHSLCLPLSISFTPSTTTRKLLIPSLSSSLSFFISLHLSIFNFSADVTYHGLPLPACAVCTGNIEASLHNVYTIFCTTILTSLIIKAMLILSKWHTFKSYTLLHPLVSEITSSSTSYTPPTSIPLTLFFIITPPGQSTRLSLWIHYLVHIRLSLWRMLITDATFSSPSWPRKYSENDMQTTASRLLTSSSPNNRLFPFLLQLIAFTIPHQLSMNVPLLSLYTSSNSVSPFLHSSHAHPLHFHFRFPPFTPLLHLTLFLPAPSHPE